MDLYLFLYYCLFVSVAYFFNSNIYFLALLYFSFIFFLKIIFFKYKISKNKFLSLNSFLSLFFWTVIFGFISLPYFYLDSYWLIFYSFCYLLFMSYVGLNGFTILIDNLSFKDSLMKTFSLFKKGLSLKYRFLICLILSLGSFFDFNIINFWFILPLLLFIATKKYLNMIK